MLTWVDSSSGPKVLSESLDSVYGSDSTKSIKSGYTLPSNIISNTDVTRLINSAEVQAVVRPAGEKTQKKSHVLKKNPLKNKQVLLRLNPYAKAYAAEKVGSAKVEQAKVKPSKGQFAEVLKTRIVKSCILCMNYF